MSTALRDAPSGQPRINSVSGAERAGRLVPVGSAESFDGAFTIRGRILGHLQASVEDIRDPDAGRRWLRIDKMTQLLELGARLAIGTVVHEQEEFESSTVAAQGIRSVTGSGS